MERLDGYILLLVAGRPARTAAGAAAGSTGRRRIPYRALDHRTVLR